MGRLVGHVACTLCLLATLSVSAAAPSAPPAPARKINIEKIIAGMTPEEKVGQLLMVGFAGTAVNSHIAHWVHDRRVGGVALFSRNLVDLEQTARFTRQLSALTEGGVPVFLALD